MNMIFDGYQIYEVANLIPVLKLTTNVYKLIIAMRPREKADGRGLILF